jgi:DNA-binding MarR family transcriptional regulator
MDYDELAHKIIRKMIERPAKGGHFRADDLPHGGKKVLLSLFLFSDGVTAGELSDKMGVSTARIASILKGLEKKDFLRRETDLRDRRRVAVFLTPKGRETAREHYEMISHFASEFFRRLGEQDTLELLRLIERAEAIFPELHHGHGRNHHIR